MTAKPMNKADREKWFAEVVDETNKELARQDEIIRMAREAGFEELYGWKDDGSCEVSYELFVSDLERFAALVAAHEREELTGELINEAQLEVQRAVLAEREACAKVCEGISQGSTRYDCAAAIRARSQHE